MNNQKKDTVLQKSTDFAVRIVNLHKYLVENKKEYTISKQILRSGTSIGANINEAQSAQTRADFNSKLHIAYKEASETQYWLNLLYNTGYITKVQFDSMFSDCNEITRMLNAITGKLRNSENQ